MRSTHGKTFKESFCKSVEERLRSGLLAEVKALEGVTTSDPGCTRAQRQASFRRRREECEWCRGPFSRNPSRDY